MGEKKVTSKQIREFWEKNPFHVYESPYKIGTKKFFEYSDHIKDSDTEKFSKHLWKFDKNRGKKVLDIGCGPAGWLVRNYAKNGAEVFGIDFAKNAIGILKKGLKIYGLEAKLFRAEAEKLPFMNNYFDFVSASGSIDHSLDTQKCVNEIYRVLKRGGETTVSLYYKSILLNRLFFPITILFIKLLLKAPYREGMKQAKSPEDLLRKIDGDNNPHTIMFTRKEVMKLFNKFEIINIECHEFVMHFMPKYIPRFLGRIFDILFPLKIFIQAKKPKA